MKGFIVLDLSFQPVSMGLDQDIVGGMIISEPVPVFKSRDDAEDAARSYGSSLVKRPFLRVVPVTLSFNLDLGNVSPVEYSEEEEG